MSRAIYRSIQAARRRRGSDHDPIKDMERETGIEPATSSLGSWRSTAELLPLERRTVNAARLPPARASHNLGNPLSSILLPFFRFESVPFWERLARLFVETPSIRVSVGRFPFR